MVQKVYWVNHVVNLEMEQKISSMVEVDGIVDELDVEIVLVLEIVV